MIHTKKHRLFCRCLTICFFSGVGSMALANVPAESAPRPVNAQADWLLDGSTYEARLTEDKDRGEIALTTYGRSSGFCVDPIEKKPLNHFLPGTPVLSFGTAGCNLTCKFCQNWDISKSRETDTLAESDSADGPASSPVRPFENLPQLPDDIQEAVESFKLAILAHKMTGWDEVSCDDVMAALNALKQLAMAPSDS